MYCKIFNVDSNKLIRTIIVKLGTSLHYIEYIQQQNIFLLPGQDS